MTTERLAGKRVLITGGTSGIGYGLVVKSRAEGANVVFTWNTDKGKASEISSSLNAKAHKLKLESAGSASIFLNHLRTMFAQDPNQNRIDYVILNAAKELSGGLEKHDWVSLRGLIDADLIGNLRIVQRLITEKYMNQSGQIAIVGSIAADGNHDQLAYSAAKSGLRGAVESLARYDRDVKEQGLGIKLIEPAFVRTPMAERVINFLERRVIKAKGGDALVQDFKDRGYVMSPEYASQRILDLTINPEVTGRIAIPEGANLHEIRAKYF